MLYHKAREETKMINDHDLNKRLMELFAEEENEPCQQCGAIDCGCPKGECTCEPVNGLEEEPGQAVAIQVEPETDEAPCGMEPELEVEPEEEITGGSVTFSTSKNTEKGSVTIEANADDMQELAKVLKLAGLTFPKDMNPDTDTGEPEAEVVADVDDSDDGSQPTMDFPKTDVNPNMSTDKAVLTSVIKDKLRDYLKNSRS